MLQHTKEGKNTLQVVWRSRKKKGVTVLDAKRKGGKLSDSKTWGLVDSHITYLLLLHTPTTKWSTSWVSWVKWSEWIWRIMWKQKWGTGSFFPKTLAELMTSPFVTQQSSPWREFAEVGWCIWTAVINLHLDQPEQMFKPGLTRETSVFPHK